MNPTAFAVIEPLGKHHDRAAFSCGKQLLDNYIKTQATQDDRKNVSRTFVLVGNEPEEIAGFYTISSTAIAAENIPTELSRKLPHYPLIPAALIGRLAVANVYRGKKHGGNLLIDAFKRIIHVTKEMAAYAVVVEAIDDDAVSFYEHYGFLRFSDIPNKLFLPMKTVEQVVK